MKESTLERNKLDKAMNKVFEAFTFGRKLRRKMMSEKEKEQLERLKEIAY